MGDLEKIKRAIKLYKFLANFNFYLLFLTAGIIVFQAASGVQIGTDLIATFVLIVVAFWVNKNSQLYYEQIVRQIESKDQQKKDLHG